MNKFAPLIHAAIAVFIQTLWGMSTGEWVAGGLMGVLFYVGREHAQAEYRYIQANGGHRSLTPKIPSIGCLSPVYWPLDQLAEVLVPLAACVFVALVMAS
jgi:hypothetical protein